MVLIELDARQLGSRNKHNKQSVRLDIGKKQVIERGDEFFNALNKLDLEPHPSLQVKTIT